jgi:hypothetical protein
MEYMPEVVQVIPTEEFKVYVYFDDGSIHLYDASELVTKGIFKPLSDIKVFKETCTVLNGTLSWSLDPFIIYEEYPEVEEPKSFFKTK